MWYIDKQPLKNVIPSMLLSLKGWAEKVLKWLGLVLFFNISIIIVNLAVFHEAYHLGSLHRLNINENVGDFPSEMYTN